MISLFALVRSTMQFFKYLRVEVFKHYINVPLALWGKLTRAQILSIHPFNNFRMEFQGLPSLVNYDIKN